jgi:hypothetical protein
MSSFWSFPFHLYVPLFPSFRHNCPLAAQHASAPRTQISQEYILHPMPFRDVPYSEPNIKQPKFRLEYAQCFGVSALTSCRSIRLALPNVRPLLGSMRAPAAVPSHCRTTLAAETLAAHLCHPQATLTSRDNPRRRGFGPGRGSTSVKPREGPALLGRSLSETRAAVGMLAAHDCRSLPCWSHAIFKSVDARPVSSMPLSQIIEIPEASLNEKLIPANDNHEPTALSLEILKQEVF